MSVFESTRHASVVVRNPDLLPTWAALADAARRAGTGQAVTVDEPGRLRLETLRGRPFCEVRVQKGHVGVYLLAVVHLGLVLPDALEQHRSGRGTLRFRSATEEEVAALEAFVANLQGLVGQW